MEFSTPDSSVIFTPLPELKRAPKQLSSLTKNFPGGIPENAFYRLFSREIALTEECGGGHDLSGFANV
jgi:hypothetical protein